MGNMGDDVSNSYQTQSARYLNDRRVCLVCPERRKEEVVCMFLRLTFW